MWRSTIHTLSAKTFKTSISKNSYFSKQSLGFQKKPTKFKTLRHSFGVGFLFIQRTYSSMTYRIERDTFGEIQVPANKYWGAQTQRYFGSSHNLSIVTKIIMQILCCMLSYVPGPCKISILEERQNGCLFLSFVLLRF